MSLNVVIKKVVTQPSACIQHFELKNKEERKIGSKLKESKKERNKKKYNKNNKRAKMRKEEKKKREKQRGKNKKSRLTDIVYYGV